MGLDPALLFSSIQLCIKIRPGAFGPFTHLHFLRAPVDCFPGCHRDIQSIIHFIPISATPQTLAVALGPSKKASSWVWRLLIAPYHTQDLTCAVCPRNGWPPRLLPWGQ